VEYLNPHMCTYSRFAKVLSHLASAPDVGNHLICGWEFYVDSLIDHHCVHAIGYGGRRDLRYSDDLLLFWDEYIPEHEGHTFLPRSSPIAQLLLDRTSLSHINVMNR
jgi:hypothetical protein